MPISIIFLTPAKYLKKNLCYYKLVLRKTNGLSSEKIIAYLRII